MKLFNYIGIFKDEANIPDTAPTTTYQQITDSDEWVTCNVKVEALDVVMLSTSGKHGVVKGGSSTNFDSVVHYYEKETINLPEYKNFHADKFLYQLSDQTQLIYMIGDTVKITAIPDNNNLSGDYNNSVLNGTFLGSVSKYYTFDDPPQYHRYTRGTPSLKPLRFNDAGQTNIGSPSFKADNVITANNKLTPSIANYRDLSKRPGFTKMIKDVESKITNSLSVVEVLKNKAIRAYTWSENLFSDGNYCYSIEKTNKLENGGDYDICKQAYIMWKADVDNGLLTGSEEIKEDLNFIIAYYSLKWVDACLDANSIISNKPEEPVTDVTEYFVESNNANVTLSWKNDIIDSGKLTFQNYPIYVHGELVPKNDDILSLLTSFNQATDLSLETSYSAKHLTFPLKETVSSMKNLAEIVTDLLLNYYVVLYIRGANDGKQRNTCFYIFQSSDGKFISCGQMPNETSNYSDTINNGSAPTDSDNEDGTIDSDEPNAPSVPDVVGIGLLTTTYGMTPNHLKDIGSFLWNSDWLSNLTLVNNNPIENIISCKIFPLTLPDGTDVIKIGNVSTQVVGGKIDTMSYKIVVDSGTITVPKKYNSFLDYEPYTQLKLYIPFISFVPISCAIAYDGISFRYAFDLINGSFTCSIKSGGKIVGVYSGNCGVDVPITSNNRAQLEVGYIRGSIEGMGQAITGNFGSASNTLLDAATNSFHSYTVGNMGATTGLCQNLTPYIIAERPIASIPVSYGHDKGYKCEITKQISELKGFTVIENVELSNISATEREKELIKTILSNGFYA